MYDSPSIKKGIRDPATSKKSSDEFRSPTAYSPLSGSITNRNVFKM